MKDIFQKKDKVTNNVKILNHGYQYAIVKYTMSYCGIIQAKKNRVINGGLDGSILYRKLGKSYTLLYNIGTVSIECESIEDNKYLQRIITYKL